MRALDPDGLAMVSAGTAIFAIGTLVCWLAREDLIAADRLWYLYVAITGTGIGIIGVIGGLVRRHRRRPEEGSVEESLIHTDRVPDRS